MSVILEFSIEPDAFVLGRALSGGPDVELELERIVPTESAVMPFVWATGDDLQSYEETVRESPSVRELIALDRVGSSGLYRVEWGEYDEDLMTGIAETEATVLEGRADGNWVFRLRFNNHDKLTHLYNYLTDHDIEVHVERTYTLTEESERGRRFGLTAEQREALVLALQRGYFATPSEADLDELAAELDISRQAVSDRIRRGNEKVLRRVLLSSVTDLN
ncbi:helix-turn-helix domain-containing protein [Haloterrigena sp. SYSU A558-1]|uniref:Helix-turn-helix domain-containing protein n=1 Tax=Haloterrigena gelatinilytica TaxID=2741724 RepID=A0A8J8GKZ2_9EURY|nr:helix-turn-helix domain-containing protein [Haloterrigena gelatinilytica]NUB91939.1 helix-turn-helix domain-containing protein [Haloterrigena gelatinilytica]NUC72235.1 helix-turn-helix domain-containing protein [Haloterrigena gelatinilytica]